MMRVLLLIVLSLVLVAPVAGYFIVRRDIVEKAEVQAKNILNIAQGEEEIDTAMNVGRYLLDNFYQGYLENGMLMRARPYLESQLLPNFLRFPRGAIQTYTLEGSSFDAAEAMIFILGHGNIKSSLWRMAGPKGQEFAVIVETKNGTGMIDPYLGGISIRAGMPFHPRDVPRAGGESNLVPLSEKSNLAYYKDFRWLAMAGENEPLNISANLLTDKTTTTFGEVDGSSMDVRAALAKFGYGPFWDYAGYKDNDNRVRTALAVIPLKVDIILTRAPDANILRTMTPAPMVENKTLTWNLKAGEKITLKDIDAGISWRPENSYIDIDQIILTPTGERP